MTEEEKDGIKVVFGTEEGDVIVSLDEAFMYLIKKMTKHEEEIAALKQKLEHYEGDMK